MKILYVGASLSILCSLRNLALVFLLEELAVLFRKNPGTELVDWHGRLRETGL